MSIVTKNKNNSHSQKSYPKFEYDKVMQDLYKEVLTSFYNKVEIKGKRGNPLEVRQAVEWMRNQGLWDALFWNQGETLYKHQARLELDLVALYNAPDEDKAWWEAQIRDSHGLVGNRLGQELARIAQEYNLDGVEGSTPITALVDRLIEKDVLKSELKAEFSTIARRYGLQTREVEEIYRDRLEAREQSEAMADTAAEIESLLQANRGELDLSKILHPNLANALRHLAKNQRVRPETFVTVLMGVASSLIKPQTSLCVNESLDWTDLSANFFGVVVAESSQRKSPIFKAIASAPLKELEKQAREEYQKALADHEVLLADYESLSGSERRDKYPDGKPKEPKRRIFSFSNATAEGLRNQLSAVPDHGILWSTDELAGMFKSQNAYRGGKGADAEEMLTAYDGSYGKVLRSEGLIADIDRISLGIVGTVQPRVLETLIGSDDDDISGKWSRFAFVHQPLSAIEEWSGGKVSLTPLLSAVYSHIDSFPAKQFRLSREADRYFGEAFLQFEARRVADPNPGMRSVWGKSEGRVAKLALILHHINAALNHQPEPSDEIGLKEVQGALILTNFYAQQIKALYSSIGNGEGLASHLAKVIELSDRKGWITASDVRRGMRSACNSTAMAREWFRELAAMGKGCLEGQGCKLKFKTFEKVAKVVEKVVDTATAENPSLREVQPKVVEVAEVADFPDFPDFPVDGNSEPLMTDLEGHSPSPETLDLSTDLQLCNFLGESPQNPLPENHTKVADPDKSGATPLQLLETLAVADIFSGKNWEDLKADEVYAPFVDELTGEISYLPGEVIGGHGKGDRMVVNMRFTVITGNKSYYPTKAIPLADILETCRHLGMSPKGILR